MFEQLQTLQNIDLKDPELTLDMKNFIKLILKKNVTKSITNTIFNENIASFSLLLFSFKTLRKIQEKHY